MSKNPYSVLFLGSQMIIKVGHEEAAILLTNDRKSATSLITMQRFARSTSPQVLVPGLSLSDDSCGCSVGHFVGVDISQHD